MNFDLDTPLTTTDHVLGTPDAAVTVVEYGDFECPNCKQAAPAVKLLLARHDGEVCFAYRHFPLEEVHPHALHAALAAEAAGAQASFWPMHDLLFEHQRHLELPKIRSYVDMLHLDSGRFYSDLAQQTYLQRVRDQIDSGHRSGVRSTPAFFVNGKVQDVSYGVQKLLDAVDRAVDERR